MVDQSALMEELRRAVLDDVPLEDIVKSLRKHRQRGVSQNEMYAVLETLRAEMPDEARQDRVTEVADFVAGFCSQQMRVWNE